MARAGQNEEATKAFAEMLRIDPENRAGQLALARSLAAEGHYSEALRLYDQILQKTPSSYEALQGKHSPSTGRGILRRRERFLRDSQPGIPRIPKIAERSRSSLGLRTRSDGKHCGRRQGLQPRLTWAITSAIWRITLTTKTL